MRVLFFLTLLALLLSLASAERVRLTPPDSNVDLHVRGNGEVPHYDYGFPQSADDSSRYSVKAARVFEATGDNGALAVVPGSVVSLASLDWSLSLPVIGVNLSIDFNLTGHLPGLLGTAPTVGAAKGKKKKGHKPPRHGAPRFSHVALVNHLNFDDADSDNATFGFLKIDIVIGDYRWVSNHSRLVFTFNLHTKEGHGQGNGNGNGNGHGHDDDGNGGHGHGGEGDNNALVSDHSFQFGQGYFSIVPTATTHGGVSVPVSLVQVGQGQEVQLWIVYERFPDGDTLVHDPEIGFGSAPAREFNMSPVFFVAAAFGAVLGIALAATAYFLRRRRDAIQQDL